MALRDMLKKHSQDSDLSDEATQIVDHIRTKYGEREAADVKEALSDFFSDSPGDGESGQPGQEGFPGGQGPQGQQQGRQKGGKKKKGKDGKGKSGKGGQGSPVPGQASKGGDSVSKIIAKMFPGMEIDDSEPGKFSRYDETRELSLPSEQESQEGDVDEWNYEAQMYTRKAKVMITPFSGFISDDSYQTFQDDFGYLVDMIKSELRKLKKRKVENVKGLKQGKIDSHRAVLEVTRVYAGKEPTGEIFTRKKELDRDYTVGILIDRSGSTSDAANDKYTRIQVEQYSALLIAKALEEIGDEYSIHAFDSKRDGSMTTLLELKSPEEKLSVEHEKRICSIRPGSFNRDGAAIRTMIKEFKKRKSKNKVFFLISDGRPNLDDDVYQKEYALEDTAKAIEEAEREGIRVVYLSIDPESDYFKTISKHASFAKSYKNVEDLPQEITNIYKSLTKLDA